MDRCHECGADLAVKTTAPIDPTPGQLWDTESTFDLISATHKPTTPHVSAAHLKEFVIKIVDELASGSCAVLGKATGIGMSSLWNWTSGRARPSFRQVTRFFRSIQCPPSALVSGFPLIIDPELIAPIDEPPLRAVTKYPKDDYDAVKKKMLALLKSPAASPPSLMEVSRRLGRSVSLLQYRYPELCKRIILVARNGRASEAEKRQRAREGRLRNALKACIQQGIYPSDRHLRRLASLAASDLRRQDLQRVIRDSRQDLRERSDPSRRIRLPQIGQVLDLREQAEAARSVDSDLSIRLYVDIATSTDDPGDWATLLSLYQEIGRRAEAIDLASALCQRFGSIPSVQSACGSVFLQEGRHKDAALAYERALSLG